jgi:pyruvate dehydrogenase E2 component (dihydrolipoamide acetyltransferase)
MPRLSDSMEEGTILRWLKQDGDEVKRGDELAEIETDKATMTYEADTDGVLKIVAQEGDTMPIGQVIATIGGGSDGEENGAAAKPAEGAKAEATESAAAGDTPAQQVATGTAEQAPPPPPSPPAAAPSPAPAPDGAAAQDNGRVKASPVARRIAKERGVDLGSLQGSGPGGRIVKADVEGAQPAPPRPAPAERRRCARAGRGARARRRGGSSPARAGRRRDRHRQGRRAPRGAHAHPAGRRAADGRVQGHGPRVHDPDRGRHGARGRDARRAEEARRGGGIRIRATTTWSSRRARSRCARSRARTAPYRDGKFELYSRINVGIAVAAENALIVPTIFDADKKGLGEIARDSRAVAERVRAGVVTPPELSGGTFTVSNLGMFGVTEFTAVINPPQAAILAVGSMEQRAVVRDGELVARHTMALTLVSDHRILYGADAAKFLARIRALLEEPLALAL